MTKKITNYYLLNKVKLMYFTSHDSTAMLVWWSMGLWLIVFTMYVFFILLIYYMYNTLWIFIYCSHIGKPKPYRNNITLGITEVTGIEFSTIVIAYPEPYYILKNENGTANKRMMNSITRNAINNFTIHFNQTIVEQSDYGSYYLELSNLLGTTTVLINVLPQSK